MLFLRKRWERGEGHETLPFQIDPDGHVFDCINLLSDVKRMPSAGPKRW
jgi:hypothetical protein